MFGLLAVLLIVLKNHVANGSDTITASLLEEVMSMKDQIAAMQIEINNLQRDLEDLQQDTLSCSCSSNSVDGGIANAYVHLL